MGGFCSACNEEQEIDMEESGWKNAVNEQNLTACQFLYLDDPSLFDKSVNKNQQKAIHIAVIKNNAIFLEWIANEPGININIIDRDGNTPLHIASQSGYSDIIEILLKNKADINIKNKKGEKPIDIAHKDIKSLFNQRNIDKLVDSNQQRRNSLTEKILIDGVSLEAYRNKKNEDLESLSLSKARQGVTFAKLTTKFGIEAGVEVEDIANFFKTTDKSKLWTKYAGSDKQSINKERDLYKVAYGLTFAALRRKNAKANNPAQEPIKYLVAALKIKLQTTRFGTSFELTQEKFINNFHGILLEISEDMKSGQIMTTNKQK